MVAFVTNKTESGGMDDDDSAFDLAEFLPYLLNEAAESAASGFAAIYRRDYGMLRAGAPICTRPRSAARCARSRRSVFSSVVGASRTGAWRSCR
jgi:hypothetical protein